MQEKSHRVNISLLTERSGTAEKKHHKTTAHSVFSSTAFAKEYIEEIANYNLICYVFS